jgi:hypothetical protein
MKTFRDEDAMSTTADDDVEDEGPLGVVIKMAPDEDEEEPMEEDD